MNCNVQKSFKQYTVGLYSSQILKFLKDAQVGGKTNCNFLSVEINSIFCINVQLYHALTFLGL